MGKAKKVYVVNQSGKTDLVLRWKHPITGQWKQKTSGTTSRKEAERLAAKLEVELENQIPRRNGQTSWTQFRERYESEHLHNLADKTVRKASTALDLMEKLARPVKLADITADSLSYLQSQMRQPSRGDTTITGYMRHLRAALGWAAERGMIADVPQFPRLRRVRKEASRGRALTTTEFERILAVAPEVIGKSQAASWQHYLTGMWWSGLRLAESLKLHWEFEDELGIDLSRKYPMMAVRAEHEKGRRDRLMALAPEFARFLLQTPEDRRKGFVFNPEPQRPWRTSRLTSIRIGKAVSLMGREAKIVVKVEQGIERYATIHDLRRSFGYRWAMKVMPPVLQELMRHENIATTMKYYVGRNADATSEMLWNSMADEDYCDFPCDIPSVSDTQT